ncbi:MAG TPA: hypothetical protein VGI21_27215 [Streptosporangiaceae bacterium]|jgi:hypothetical protein
MKSHNWILPAGKHAKAGPAIRLAEAARADGTARAARTVTAATLVLSGVGGFAAEGAAAAVHTPGDQASSSAIASSGALTTLKISPAHAIANPWRM